MVPVKVTVVTEQGGHRMVLAVNNTKVEAPPFEHLAYYTGLGLLAAAEVIEWPLAVLLMAGHALMDMTHRPALNELGEALEEA